MSDNGGGKWNFVKSKVQRLLVPYIFWAILMVVLYPLDTKIILSGAGHLWFLLCLFDLMVLAALIIPFIAKSNFCIDLMIFVFVWSLHVVNKNIELPNIFGISNAVNYLPPFLIGIYSVKYNIINKICRLRSVKFYGIYSVVAISSIIFILKPILPFGTIYMNIPLWMFLLLTHSMILRYSPVDNLVLSSLDKNSLGIYILHQFIGKYTLMYYLSSFIEFYDNHCLLAPMLLFLWMFFVAWFTSNQIQKKQLGRLILGNGNYKWALKNHQ